jgi:hypothetical protein
VVLTFESTSPYVAGTAAILLSVIVPPKSRLVVQNSVQKRVVDVDLAVVGTDSQFPKLVHEEAHP